MLPIISEHIFDNLGGDKLIKNRISLYKMFLTLTVIFLVSLIFHTNAISFELILWEHYSDGYARSFEYASENELPLVIFFHVEEDTWSKKLAENYLTHDEVENFLRDIPKVEINPQIGDIEFDISNRLKVNQFPALIITLPCCVIEPTRLNPFLKGGEMAPEEFIQRIKDIITTQYSEAGNIYLKNKKYDKAVHFFEIVIEIDPNKAYGYYAMGFAYHAKSAENNEVEYVEKAMEFYEKALEIEPGHIESRQELERLGKNFSK